MVIKTTTAEFIEVMDGPQPYELPAGFTAEEIYWCHDGLWRRFTAELVAAEIEVAQIVNRNREFAGLPTQPARIDWGQGVPVSPENIPQPLDNSRDDHTSEADHTGEERLTS